MTQLEIQNNLDQPQGNQVSYEACLALVQLGLKETAAKKAVEKAMKKKEIKDVAELITEALRFS